ncbi:MAG: ATP synthase subunit I [Acidimicrobiia bacterium]|nr:ATP synthase subunit I [Acidimicrobiia bacterium]
MIPQAPDAHGPEGEVARDLARLGLFVSPGFAALGLVFWGGGGALSSGLAIGIVITNFLLGAAIIGRTASISPELLMIGVLGGFVLRLLLLGVVVVPLRDLSWFEVVPFAITLVGGHLGLLAWETQRVSMTLAYPGLRPSNRSPVTTGRTRSQTK